MAGISILKLGPATLPQRPVTAQTRQPTVTFIAGPIEDARFPGLNPLDTNRQEWILGETAESSERSNPAFTFDIGKITARVQVLFPFLTPGLSLAHFVPASERNLRRSLPNPLTPAGGRPTGAVKMPLVLSDVELQSLIDKSWSRSDRWNAFQPIATLVGAYSPDVGQLPSMLHAYSEQNLLQPYADTTTRDPRLWTELSLAADHVTFIGFVRRFAADHPSTKATTELLLTLDKVIEASHDALKTLLDTDPIEQLRSTRAANRHAYDVIVAIRQFYTEELRRRRLLSAKALAGYYDSVRLSLLAGILHSTPDEYRASDARFLMGAILWRRDRQQEALKSWRGMTIDPTDAHVIAYTDVLTAISAGAGPTHLDGAKLDPALVRDINRALESDRGRWLMFSLDRLRQFGYRIDSF